MIDNVKEVGVPVSKEQVPEHSIHQDVMAFLQHISHEVKVSNPPLKQSISDKIDNFIRKHGNKHPEVTK